MAAWTSGVGMGGRSSGGREPYRSPDASTLHGQTGRPPLAELARRGGAAAADALGAHLDAVVVVARRGAHDMLQGMYAADADIQLAGAKSFEGDGEAVGDLPAPR